MENNRSILIVDDDPGVRDSYRDILSPDVREDFVSMGADLFGESPTAKTTAIREPYELTVVETGEHALDAVEECLTQDRPFAVAFVDMKMPGMDGAETSERIWAMDPRIKIVIVSAFSEYTPEEIIRTTGRDDVFYLRKPFNPEEIRQFARSLTSLWNLERERESLTGQLQASNEQLADMNRNLEEKVEKQTALLVQSEKMASIGILAAGVAHEINNPISFVKGNLSALKKYVEKIVDLMSQYDALEDMIVSNRCEGMLSSVAKIRDFKKHKKIDFIMSDIEGLIDESLEGTDRVGKIVTDMKTFARLDEAEIKPIDVHQSIDSTLNMVWNQIKYHSNIVKDYGKLPDVTCLPQKLSQVFMNLIMNAAQAIEGNGDIYITTRHVCTGRPTDDEFVEIAIRDNGKGIPENQISRIFDPFFTTKPVGEGTGLGLSIVYDIIKAHKGTISVKSEPGLGTTFTILLPVTPVF